MKTKNYLREYVFSLFPKMPLFQKEYIKFIEFN